MSPISWQWTPYTIPLVLSTLAAAAMAAYTTAQIRRRGSNDRALVWFVAVTALASLWSLTYLIKLSATSLETKLLLDRLTVAPYFMTVAWVAFAAAYSDTDWLLDRRVLAVLFAAPVAYLLVLPFDPATGLVIDGSASTVERLWPGGPVVLRDALGLGYYVNIGFHYVLVLAGAFLLIRSVAGSRRVYRGQGFAVLVAVAIPFLLNAAHQLEIVFDPRVNLTSVAFTVSVVILGIAVVRYELLDLIPVARDTVIESMRDGYLVLDGNDRVVDANPAANRLLPSDDPPIGQHAEEVLSPFGVDDWTGSDGPNQTEVVLEDGDDLRYVTVDASSLTKGDRDVGRLVTLRDVTDRRSVERRYRALIEHSSDAITVVDEDGEIRYASPAADRVFGRPPDVLVGSSAASYVHPTDRDRVHEKLGGVTATGDSIRSEYRIEDPSGDWRVVESVASDPDTPFVEGIVVNTRDVTDRHEREQELAEKNERLEEFASVVSHDLRNPLAVARGHLDVAVEDPAEHVPKAKSALERMDDIIDDVLTLARQGDAVGEVRSVSLEDVAGRAWQNVATGTATLVVEDDGPGIPAEERHRVFDSGYTTTDGGTGFGLAIVERIVAAHGWSITAVEGTDGGARFAIVLDPAAPERNGR